MIRTFSRTAVLAATLAALAAVQPSSAQSPTLAIDAGISDNGPTTLGVIENCVEIEDGDTVQLDVVVQDISDLLAWEIYIDHDPAILRLIEQDVKLFQQANEGSAVLDVSARVPDDSGFHSLAAFDSADPLSPDSGSGVLARVTFEAVGEGESPVRFGNRDLNEDGAIDRGTLLRSSEAEPIGDENGDKFFDGDSEDALVVVGGECPAGSVVAAPPEEADSSDDSSFPWLIVALGSAAAAVMLAAGAFVLLSRHRASRRASTGA